MENLFLRVLAVSLAVSVLLAPLLLCRGRLERRYAPQTRWWLWLAMALVLLAAPWLPKPQAPVVVEAPVYTVHLPARPAAGLQSPVNAPAQSGAKGPQDALAGGQIPLGAGQTQAADPARSRTEAAQSTGLSLVLLAAGVWLAGMAAVLLWQEGRYLLLRRRLLAAARPVSGLEGYARELGLEGRVTFYECESISGPMTLGLFRPAVLLPAAGAAPAALRHELHHVKRRDVGYKTLLLLACALHWFNPLVWRMARAADRDVEACCDAAVVAGQDKSYRRCYGELLLSAAGTGRELPFTTSFGGGKEQMKSRLAQLFRPGKRSRALVCAVLAGAVLLGSLVACESAAPLTAGQAVQALEESIIYENDKLSFTIPKDYRNVEGWNIQISGRGELEGMGGMSLHYLDDEVWEAGRTYTLDIAGELWPEITELTMDVSLEGESRTIDLLAVRNAGIIYVNEAYGFTLRLPENWAGQYQAVDRGGGVLTFYQTGGMDPDDPAAGAVMDLVVTTREGFDELYGDKDLDGIYDGGGPRLIVLGETAERLVYLHIDPLPQGKDEAYIGMWETAVQLSGRDFSWLEGETAQPLTENTMPHLDFYDPETQFLVYHTQTGLYFNYGGGEERESFRQETFRCDRSEGGRVMDTVDVRYRDGEVWFSDCSTDGSEIRYYTYDIAGHTIREQDGPFDPEPELLAPADPRRIFDQGQYQPSHTYSLWSNALVCSDGTLAALAVNGILEGGGTLDALEIVRMGEIWWEENRLLTPERLSAPADYVSPDWGFVIHLPRSFEGQYLIQRDYNASGLPCWSFYHRDSYAGPNGAGFLFSVFAQDAETFWANGYEGDTVLKEQNGIVYTMTTLPYREDWFSGDYLELLEAAESVTGENLDLSGVTRSTGYLWPVPGTGQTQDVVLRMFGQDGLDGVSLLIPNGGWPRSVAAGTVSAVRQEPGSGFYTVSVDHGNGIVTSYGHLSHVWVSEGSALLRGDGLGLVEESDGQCALLFAWNENGQYINPVNDVEWRREDFSVVDPVDLLYAGDPHIPSALRSVLLGETTFYDVERGEYCYVSALPFSDDAPVKASRFTELDMDGDTIPEVVLWLERGGNEYEGSIVLHYQNGWVCGYPMGYRSLELLDLKEDGSYGWSGGASNWGWGRMDFQTGKTSDISWVEGENYYVDGQSATREDFYRADDERAAKEDVTWMELTRENIALVY